ncbi:MAG: substrate-binding domain-containing protein, partial [Prochlorococcaceae cyanobacterium]
MARHRQCSALLLTASLALLSGCGDRVADSSDSGGSASLTISGSSTVFPVIEKAIEGFAKTDRGRDVRVTLSEVGTTGGMREFCQGAIPIANASRPISSAELKACADKGITFIELPLAFDALTVVVNGNNDWASAITTKELSRTWSKEAEGTIKNWQQINIDWPDRPLRLCAPGTDSGTFDYFNEAINGDKANSRSDFEGSEDDNVIVECVGSDPNAMGYFGFAYYQANQDR